MIVVADTGPLNYLVLIEAVEVLQPLYSNVVVPTTVAEELRSAGAPSAVQKWIAQPPEWLEGARGSSPRYGTPLPRSWRSGRAFAGGTAAGGRI